MNIQSLNPFREVTAEDIVEKQLLDYKRQVILHETQVSYHKKMAEHCRERLNALNLMSTAFVAASNN